MTADHDISMAALQWPSSAQSAASAGWCTRMRTCGPLEPLSQNIFAPYCKHFCTYSVIHFIVSVVKLLASI